jgi:hypothetical protein
VSCIWIGPPWGNENGPYKKSFARVKELSDYLSQIVAPCRYINSLAFSQPGEWPTRDGVHLTANSMRLWDDKVIGAIDQLATTLPHHQADTTAVARTRSEPAGTTRKP